MRSRWGLTVRITIAALTVGAAVSCSAPAHADSAPDAGIAFEPPPLPASRYSIRPPSSDPAQVRVLTAADGTPIYTETWLPGPLGGAVPPARVPVIVQYTPYATPGVPDAQGAINLLVPLGYGVTVAHVRGSGGSGGCIGLFDQHEVDDGALVIEDAGELAPWSSGSVGMMGGSYPGGTQVAVATGPDRDRLETLKALAVVAPAASLYDVVHRDGVPNFLSGIAQVVVYFASLTNPLANPAFLPQRPGCLADLLAGVAIPDGSYTPFFEERDHPRNVRRLEAATLMVHGSSDRRVSPLTQAGLFDALLSSTPRAGLFGVWGHESPDAYGPDATGPRRDWERDDFKAMLVAWFDRHLRGADNGVDAWPVAQVQGTDGQWRTASTWPGIPGPPGILRLGAGVLGAADPSGSTTYLEGPVPELEGDGLPTDVPGTAAVFTTTPLAERLEMVGEITVDLWVQLALPDSHITARLEVIDADGQRLTPDSRTVGARSAQHLDPITNGRFTQRTAKLAPVGQPVQVTVRLSPIDLVAPAGSRLRLTIAGSSIVFDGLDGLAEGLGAVFQGPSSPSLAVQPVTILHDAAHPSALRYSLPEASSVLLDVREQDQAGVLGAAADATVDVDGGLGSAGGAAGPSAPSTPPSPTPSGSGRLPATGGDGQPVLAALAVAATLLLRTARRRPHFR